MKIFKLVLAIILIFSCKTEKNNNKINEAYNNAFMAYTSELAQNRINYLQLTGLFKLDSLNNSFGKDSVNDFMLNIPQLPKTIGTITLLEDGITFNASEDVLVKTKKDSIINSFRLNLNAYGSSIKLFHEQLSWQVITRSGHHYLRVWDTKNPAIVAFKGYVPFRLSPKLIVKGKFTYYDTTKTEEVHSQLGVNASTEFIGKVEFLYNGEVHDLDVGEGGFTMVSDQTTGETTYGGGRYIYLDLPDSNGPITIDFNHLYNPPCAFSEFTTCLYPPRQNVLPFEVRAGETIDLLN